MDYTIQDLPEQERPREKLEQKGLNSLTEVELLSIILRTGTSGKNVKELSSEILNSYSLASLADRSLSELKDFEGVSKVKAGQLKALGELARRMQNEDREKVESFSDVRMRVQDMKFLDSEVVRVFLLSSGNEILGEEEFMGEVSNANFSFQKLFRKALEEKAAAIVLAHNHPSGKSEPTDQDIETTKELLEMGGKLGIQVLDHIIIGDEVKSMRRETGVKF